MSLFGSSLAAKAETPSATISTSAADLVAQPSNNTKQALQVQQVAQTQVAQTIDPGRPTRGVSSGSCQKFWCVGACGYDMVGCVAQRKNSNQMNNLVAPRTGIQAWCVKAV